jgi:hypothetical protein
MNMPRAAMDIKAEKAVGGITSGYDTDARDESLTIFHSHKNVLQSRKIAALFTFQDLNHLDDNRSLKLKLRREEDL